MTALPLLVAIAACAASPASELGEHELRQATVSLGGFCAGVVVGPREVLTAAHCVSQSGQSIRVHYETGDVGVGEAVAVDRASDLAVLHLRERAPVLPLAIRSKSIEVGEPVLFTGRNDFRHPFERASVERVGQCPSLPSVSTALFTTIRARPGDSGAPLVDERFQVVGLVHGGARCHIAAPTAGASQLVAQARQTASGIRSPAAARRVGRPRAACPPGPRQR